MALPAAAYQLLLTQVGDTPDGLLAGMAIPLRAAESLWDAAPLVQEQAVLVRMCDILTAYWRDALSRVLDENERKTIQLRLDSLRLQREAAVLAQAVQQLALSVTAGVVAGRLTTSAPIASPLGAPDANASWYHGDPNWRGGW